MLKIQFGGTIDPLERTLLAIFSEWDELERWALHNNYTDRAKIAAEEKWNLLGKIAALRSMKKEA